MATTVQRLTYAQYMAEEEDNRRYDIIDGVRTYMPNPTITHQRILLRIAGRFEAYEQATRRGVAVIAPCDVLIRRDPLRIRQPDVLFISVERLGNRDLSDPAPLEPAPELVVEILSPSDTSRVLTEKIADYCRVGVRECWIVARGPQTVEVQRLSAGGAETVAIYGVEETVQSITFSGLTLSVADVLSR